MSINREINSMFSSFSSGFNMDNGYSMVDMDEEMYIDDVDMALARQVCEQALYAAAFEDVTEKANEYVYVPSDRDDVAYVVEAQVAMKRLGNRQYLCQEGIDQIQSRLDMATKGDFLPRQKFVALVERKKELLSEKLRLRALWNKGLASCKSVIGDDMNVWGTFFSIEDHEAWLAEYLADDSISTGFIYGETDAIDNGTLLPEDDNGVADLLSVSHLVEMREYDAPESNSVGYWDWKVEKNLENKSLEIQSQNELLF